MQNIIAEITKEQLRTDLTYHSVLETLFVYTLKLLRVLVSVSNFSKVL